MVASLVNADLLILLTDIDGLYDSNPKINPNAKFIDYVENKQMK
jgi:glutamate 5-kinase